MKIKIGIKDAVFYSFHGYYIEEQKMGHHFVVNAYVEVLPTAVEEDLTTTVNYADIYAICEEEMKLPRKLLETVASDILNRFKSRWPDLVGATIRIDKKGVQLGGSLASSYVELSI